MPKAAYWFAFFLLLPCALTAQNSDTTTQIHTEKVSRRALMHKPSPWQGIDSSIELIHQFNPAYQFGRNYTNLGSYGSPVFNRTFTPFTKATFRTGIRGYRPYLFHPRTIPFFDSYTPFTNLEYVQRTNGELQDLGGVHSRNLTPFWNAAVHFNTMRTNGGYLAQLNNRNNIALNTRFQSKNGRYRGFLSGVWNNLRNQQNGGIADIDEFKDPETDGRARLTVNLEEAFSRYKMQDYTYDQFLHLGPEQVDTIYKAQDTFIRRSVASPLQVHHQFSYKQQGYAYRDQNLPVTDSFYPAVNLDSTLTYDSLKVSRVRNALTLGNFQSPDSLAGGFRYRAGAAWHLLQVQQGSYGEDTTLAERRQNFQQILLMGKIAMDLAGQRFTANARFFPAGRYRGDLKTHAKHAINFDSSQNLTLHHRFQRREPALLYGNMTSNHLEWDLTLKKPVLNQVAGTYQHSDLNLKARMAYTLMNNYLYYDKNIQPAQVEAPLNTVQGHLQHRFELDPFYFYNQLNFQAFSKPDVIRRPNWTYQSSLYYKNHLFDSNLLLTAGLDFRYTQAYEGKAYFPAYNLRYIQDNQRIAGYPVFDAHVNFKIGQFRGFLKMPHLNKGLAGHDYFGMPGYPMHPRMFTIGIQWMFFN